MPHILFIIIFKKFKKKKMNNNDGRIKNETSNLLNFYFSQTISRTNVRTSFRIQASVGIKKCLQSLFSAHCHTK
jgi:hypothetical protein